MINQKLLFIYILFLTSFSVKCAQQNSDNRQDKIQKILLQIQEPMFSDSVFNIKNFGAVNDGNTLNTEFINKAIKVCSKNGGGTVLVPSGVFLTGAIHLQNNVNLKIEEGGELKFSTNPEDYLPLVKTSWEGILCYNYSPLIFAENKTNIAISGKGTLNGNASSVNWWKWKGRTVYGWESGMESQVDKNNRPLLDIYNQNRTPVEERQMGEGKYLRPQFIQLFECDNILIEDVKIIHSPFWVIHPVFCSNITVRNVQVNSMGPNSDGCDPESSKNVLIENCTFNTGDDCIALKSGRNEDGRQTNKPIENVVIRNCKMENGHGGVVIGSEISGGVKNVFIENCEMNSPQLDRAIRIKTNNNRGGVTNGVFINNVTVGQVSEAVVRINCKYAPTEGHGNFPPLIKNIHISNVHSNKANYALLMEGLKDVKSVENIFIEDCTFSGVTSKNRIENIHNLQLKNVKINDLLVK